MNEIIIKLWRLIKIVPLLATISLISKQVNCQNKNNLTLSFASGFFNSSHFQNAKKRQFYSFTMDYSISKKHSISTEFLSGKHLYYDNIRSNNAVPLNIPGYEKNANAKADYRIFSLIYKYTVINKGKFIFQSGAGLGIQTQIFEYPYTENTNPLVIDFRQSSSTGICFPIKLNADFKISRRFLIGLNGGIYFAPDDSFLGEHLGLNLGFML